DCDLIFSSLPADIAKSAEEGFAVAGYPVISNSSSWRMAPDVPLLIPEVNHDHLRLLETQRATREFAPGGFLVTNPNCSTIMLALALAPLHAHFGVTAAVATTMQALSGAGYPGVASLDATDNVLPFIEGEEEKIERETLKILGRMDGTQVEHATFPMSAQCNRVNVSDGHMASIRVKLARATTVDEIRDTLSSFTGRPQELHLHTAPARPIIVRDEPARPPPAAPPPPTGRGGGALPQPRLDRDAGAGMSVASGRIAPDSVLDFHFV